MKNKVLSVRMKKTLCVLLSVSLVLEMTGCGKAKEETTTVSEDTVSGEAALGEALDQMSARSTADSGKEETVYAFSDANGIVNKVIVSDWIKNKDAAKQLADASDLTDIENVKGYETFSQDADGKITWDADGADIYYQGNTDKDLPVDVKVSYYLDGKEMSPEEMLGKSGYVTIRFDYDNHATFTAQVGDHEENLPIPFAMISGLIMPTDKFKDIEVANGKVISEGSNSIVVGVAFPGLQDSLNLEGVKNSLDEDEDDIKEKIDDIDIPDYVEVSANCVDFSLDMTLTVAMSDVLSSVNTTDSIDLSEIDDKLDDLDEATGELKDGVGDLKDGTEDLVDGVGDLHDGTTILKDSTWDLKNGTSNLVDGANDLKDGTIELLDGANDLDDGAGDLRDGSKKLKSGSAELDDGITELSEKVTGLSSQLTDGFAEILGKFTASGNGIFAASNALESNLAELAEATAGFSGLLTTYFATYEQQMMADIQKAKISYNEAHNQHVNAVAAVEAAQEEADAAKKALLTLADGGEYQLDTSSITTDLDGEDQGTTYDGSARSAVEIYDEAQQKLSNAQAEEATAAAKQASAQEDIANLVGMLKNYNSGAFPNTDVGNAYAKQAATAAYLMEAADTISGNTAKLSSVATALNTGLHALYVGLRNTMDGLSNQKEGLPALLAGIEKLKKGSSKLYKGTKDLYSGTGDLKDGTEDLLDGAHEMDDGANDLKDGANDLHEGSGDLCDVADQLNNGALDLRDGSEEMDDGVAQLQDGVNEFDEEGVQKIIDLFGDDVHDVVDRINAISDAGDDYQTFTKLPENTKGSVKFIYKTDAVK